MLENDAGNFQGHQPPKLLQRSSQPTPTALLFIKTCQCLFSYCKSHQLNIFRNDTPFSNFLWKKIYLKFVPPSKS